MIYSRIYYQIKMHKMLISHHQLILRLKWQTKPNLIYKINNDNDGNNNYIIRLTFLFISSLRVSITKLTGSIKTADDTSDNVEFWYIVVGSKYKFWLNNYQFIGRKSYLTYKKWF